MSFFLSWDASIHFPKEKKVSQKEELIKTTTAYTQSTTITITTSNFYLSTINNTQVKKSTENMSTYIQTISFHTYSSIINTTQKSKFTIHNKIFISLFTSLILISLCIGLSYCIFIYFTHYLDTKSTIKQDKLLLNRASFTSTEDSNSDTQLHTCKTKNNILSKTIDNKNKERHSPTDSVKLFRY